MINDLVRGDEECLESVLLALRWLDRSTDCDIPRPHPPRKALERDVMVVTVYGRERPEFHTNFYLPSTEQWYLLPSTSCEPKHVFSESECYDPDLNLWSPAPWTKLDSDLEFMKLNRTSLQIHDVLVVKDEICFVVVAGYLSTPALWRYNADLNLITPLFDWVEKVCFCAVVVDKLIYAIGGVMLKDTHSYGKRAMYRSNLLSRSSTFDTEGNEWKEIAPLKEARTGARGVCKNREMIFIAGWRTRDWPWLAE